MCLLFKFTLQCSVQVNKLTIMSNVEKESFIIKFIQTILAVFYIEKFEISPIYDFYTGSRRTAITISLKGSTNIFLHTRNESFRNKNNNLLGHYTPLR